MEIGRSCYKSDIAKAKYAEIGDLIRCGCERLDCDHHPEAFVVLGFVYNKWDVFDGYIVYDTRGDVQFTGTHVVVVSKALEL